LDSGPVTPVVVYTGPTRTPDEIAKLEAQIAAEPVKKRAKRKTAAAKPGEHEAAKPDERRPVTPEDHKVAKPAKRKPAAASLDGAHDGQAARTPDTDVGCGAGGKSACRAQG